MRADLLDRYIARLCAESAGLDSLHIDVPYMAGRKRYEAGRRWSGMPLVYRAQRIARLGYADAAHGRPVRKLRDSAAPVTNVTYPAPDPVTVTN
ncbi:Uncharacterised protein [Ectopseudomonas oleovorans]|uniref:Uncharacterized protein n=1 Tax=Ectopseudomonas oleovorans TaxID=301 RepID=A0A379K0L0_ECTOL|nr:hypothetical protein [Pseudomonas oleovorans]SUD57839.1 Uncharacterised protein [Pseudomonas oleovorans]